MKNKLEVNSIIELECTEITYEGLGKCFFDGKPIFVLGLFTGERALVKINKVLSNYSFGSIIKYLQTSNKREKTDMFYTISGSAPLYGLEYNEQVRLKSELINKFFNWKFPNLLSEEIKISKSKNINNYRNKSKFVVRKVKNVNTLFSYVFNTNELVEISECPIVDNEKLFSNIKQILKALDILNYLDIYEIIGRIYDNDECVVKLLVNNNKIDVNEIKTLFNNINVHEIQIVNNRNRVLFAKKFSNNEIKITLNSKEFHVDIDSFFQIDTLSFSQIIDDISKYFNRNNNQLIDLYCGVGTLGISLYRDNISLYGIEINQNAIKTSSKNLLINNIPLINNKYIVGDAKKIEKRNFNFSKTTLVLDPPRSGIDKELIEKILEWKPSQLIYISCDFKTQLRDLEFLLKEYKIDFYKAYDIFAHTMHFETVAILSLNE